MTILSYYLILRSKEDTGVKSRMVETDVMSLSYRSRLFVFYTCEKFGSVTISSYRLSPPFRYVKLFD